jgi:DNA modification methylase
MTVRIITGHVLSALAQLPDESVHCVVCSPPYYGLRDYGIEPQVWGGDPGCEHDWNSRTIERELHQTRAVGRGDPRTSSQWVEAFCRHCNGWRGSLGLEPTPALYIEHMVTVFREIRRVLRKDGTLWLNIGDSYAAGGGFFANAPSNLNGSKQSTNRGSKHQSRTPPPGIKAKDLLGVPWMLAFALRDDGWWLRSEITWAKKAPMPESCTDRPTSATEKVFLLTKSAKYFFDSVAIQEESETENLGGRQRAALKNDERYIDQIGGEYHEGRPGRFSAYQPSKRNMRNFLLLGPSPFPGAHFATFHPKIPEIAILAGTSERGVCPKCGAGWERITKSSFVKLAQRRDTRKAVQPGADMADINSRNQMGYNETETIGWRPTCKCDAADPIPATVLDPFLGSGTTAMVADRLGRNCIGIEINPQYAAMAERRIKDDAGMFAQVAAE